MANKENETPAVDPQTAENSNRIGGDDVPATETGVVVLSGSDLRTALKGASHSDKLAALRAMTSFTGAPSEKIDAYLGKRLLIHGAVIQHGATVRIDDDKQQVNPITGEKIEYAISDRAILKVETPDKQQRVVAFMSIAVTGFVQHVLEPCFGAGDYAEPVPVMIMQTTAKKGRSYNVQIVE